MKPASRKLAMAGVLAGLALNARALDQDLVRFVAAKEAQARELAKAQTNDVPSLVWSFFDAVRADDWKTATNLGARLEDASGRYFYSSPGSISPALQTAIWPVINEVIGTYECFHDWDNRLLHRFGSEIMNSIPRGSIYFGGTDPGRFVISALSDSHREGRPFFTLTQNQLVDRTYIDYLRSMYGSRLYIPTTNDLQTTFSEYTQDASQRLKSGKLKPGEDVRRIGDQVQVSGQVAVMTINGLLARIIFEKNSDHEFYIEESFPLDWMYPYLSPHGLILKLNPKPLTGPRAEEMEKDGVFWKRLTAELIGDWITDQTSVKAICDFAEKVYLRKDRDGFKGDADFLRDQESQKTFSKLRTSIAGLYLWRADQATGGDERERMHKAADLAFRQALALCPYSPDVVRRYAELLKTLKRDDEAVLIAETCIRLDPASTSPLRELLQQLRKRE